MDMPDISNIKEMKDYREGTAKLSELHFELSKINTAIDDIHSRLSQKGEQTDTLTDAANRLLSGESENVLEQHNRHKDQMYTELDGLKDRRKVINRAIELQKENVNTLKATASAAAGNEARASYRETVRKMVAAAINLAKNIEEGKIYQELFAKNDIQFYRNPVVFPRIGTLSDSNSPINYILREIVKDGHITTSEVEELKKTAA